MTSKHWPLATTMALLLTTPAPAESGTDVLLSAGASFRHLTRVDLAEIAATEGHGRGEDQGPGSLAFELGAGVLLPPSIELRAHAWLGAGGLALGEIERRYFGAGPERVGSALSVGAGASARYSPSLGPATRVFFGPALDGQRLTAASPLGSAHLSLLGLGLDAGVRLRTGALSRSTGGHLELTLGVRRELPIGVWVGRSRDDVLFSGVQATGRVYAFGVGAAYVLSFNDAL